LEKGDIKMEELEMKNGEKINEEKLFELLKKHIKESKITRHKYLCIWSWFDFPIPLAIGTRHKVRMVVNGRKITLIAPDTLGKGQTWFYIDGKEIFGCGFAVYDLVNDEVWRRQEVKWDKAKEGNKKEINQQLKRLTP